MASNKFVRSSKFRHIFGTPFKKEKCYDNVRITKSPWESNMCAVNSKFLAVVLESQGGGAFLVAPLEQCGRFDINYPKVSGHASNIMDIAWDPFDENILASAGEDCLVKIWDIPDGGFKENVEKDRAKMVLEGHQRKVGVIEWHPCAKDILASAGFDGDVKIWNVETGDCLFNIENSPDQGIFSISWSYDGSQMVTTAKDKKIRVFDPRVGDIREGDGHPGTKPSKAVFCGTMNYIFTSGFSKSNDRQYALWNPGDLNKALTTQNIDNASGTLFLYYDEGCKVIYTAGKGDTQIKYFEIVPDAPYVHFLSMHTSKDGQRGLGSMPKRHLDYMHCEVMRFYKLTNKGMIEPIAMTVPRKSEMFQDDIYPPCPAGVPALTADEWAGGIDKNPVLVKFTKDGLVGDDGSTVVVNKQLNKPLSYSKQSSTSSTSSSGDKFQRSTSPDASEVPTTDAKLLEENRQLRSEVQALKSQLKDKEAQLKQKDDMIRKVKQAVS